MYAPVDKKPFFTVHMCARAHVCLLTAHTHLCASARYMCRREANEVGLQRYMFMLTPICLGKRALARLHVFCSIPEIKCRYVSVRACMCVHGRATSVCLRAQTLARVLRLCVFAQTPSFRVMT